MLENVCILLKWTNPKGTNFFEMSKFEFLSEDINNQHSFLCVHFGMFVEFS